MADVRFDLAAHRCTIDGERVPSVGRILRAAGVVDPASPYYTDEARLRGSHFHLASQYFDEGRLDWSSVTDPIVLARLQAYETWLDEQAVTVTAIERPIACARFRYWGIVDRIVRLGRTGLELPIDFKPNPAPWHRLQIGAYTRALGVAQGALLYLPAGKKRAKFVLVPAADAGAEFLAHRLRVGDAWRAVA